MCQPGVVAKKTESNLMKRKKKGHNRNGKYAFQKAPRCTATSKRTRQRCKAPAVRGYNVCRFHGARGGAPKGEANGAWKHGQYSEAAKGERLVVKLLLQDVSSLRAMVLKRGS